MKKNKKYWAGCINDKLVVWLEEDDLGFYYRSGIFTSREDARKRFKDVRAVEIKEIKERKRVK